MLPHPKTAKRTSQPKRITAGRIAGPSAPRRLGEDRTQQLEYVPGPFKVIEHVRPKFSCRACEAITQGPAARPIARGRLGPGLLAHILVSKCDDHLPLYRQSEIFARQGLALSRSTLADQVGHTARLHADETPVPVLDPGTGPAPPAVVYRSSPGRGGDHPQAHLEAFTGCLQVDGYAGYSALFEPDPAGTVRVLEVNCWAHGRRGFHDLAVATKGKAPVACEALERSGALYAIEAKIRGQAAEVRRDVRQAEARPLLEELKAWMMSTLERLDRKSETAKALSYVLNRWTQLIRYLDDGRLEIDNNPAERALRAIAIGRKKRLFAGAAVGAERAAALYTLIETAKLNGLNPEAYLRDVIARIADHKVSRIDELLPWNWAKALTQAAAA